MKKIFLTREEVNINNWWYKITTTLASIYQHFNLTGHSLKKAIRVWSLATGEFYVIIVYLYTRSHEYEKFLIILGSVKFETKTISPTVHHMISFAQLGFWQGVIYDIGILFYNSDSFFYVCFLYDINNYTKIFSNGCTNTFFRSRW